MAPERTSQQQWPALHVEVCLILVCSVIMAIGLSHDRFGVGETLALIVAVACVRVMALALLAERRRRRARRRAA